MFVDVQCKFMYKSDHDILSYGHFKILAPACPRWGDGIDPEFFVSSLYISVAIKVRFLKFNKFTWCSDKHAYNEVTALAWLPLTGGWVVRAGVSVKTCTIMIWGSWVWAWLGRTWRHSTSVTEGWVVKADVSVTWNALSWPYGHEFEPLVRSNLRCM